MKGMEKSGNSSRTNPTMINVTRTPRPIVRPPTSQARHVTNNNNNNPNQNVVPNAPSRAIGLPPTPPTSTLHREQDQYMPLTNLVRVMRRALPPHAKVAEGAKETIQECVSEFISFVTMEANNKCHQEQRKTITADDLIWAMGQLGFDNYVGPLSLYLQKYREMEGTDRARPSKNVGLVRGRSEYNYGFQGAGPWAGSGLMPGPATMPPLPMNPNHGLLDYHNDGSGSSSGSNMGFGYTVAGANEASPIISLSPNMDYNFGSAGNNEKPGSGKSNSSAAASSSEDDLGSFDPQIFFN